jgi:hypothetical protein
MRKVMTPQQAETSKARAEQFVRTVLQDDDHADSIADESLEDWADRKKVHIAENPRRVSPDISEKGANMPTTEKLLDRIKELEEENDDLQDQLDQIADIAAPPDEDEDSNGDDDDPDGDSD